MPVTKVELGTGPDTSGSESLYSGFTKINGNYDVYASTEGADLIGYNNTTSGLTATDVRAAIDELKATGAVGEANTSSNLGAGQGLATAKVGVDLPFKSLIGGNNITLSADANTITIDGDLSGDNLINITRTATTLAQTGAHELVIFTATGTYTLLDPASDGQKVTVKNATTASTVTIDPGTKNIDQGPGVAASTTDLPVYSGGSVQLAYDATNSTWWII